MRTGGKWVIRTITSGKVRERSKVWVPAQTKVRKGRVKGSTTASKRDSNERSAIKQLARVINCNFSRKDLYLTLSYDEENIPEGMAELNQDATNFIRRIERAIKKLGHAAPKRIIVCSVKDGKTGEVVRPHVHIPISGEGLSFSEGEWMCGKRKLRDIWGKGWVYAEPLRAQDDYTPLATYLIRQAGDAPDGKKYRCSQNMAKPIITEEEAKTGRPMRAPAGTIVVEQTYNELAGVNYVRYITLGRKERHERL